MTIVMKLKGERDRIGWVEVKDSWMRLLFTVNTGRPPKSWEDGKAMILRRADAK